MFQLANERVEKIKSEMQRYETKQSAIIPALYQVQEQYGWVSKEALDFLADLMEIPVAEIREVFTFYTMFNQKPTGKFHLQVCTNISCSMAGGRELTDYICKKLNVKPGDTTADGKFSVSKVECLGSCDTAPVMQNNFEYHENLNEAKIDQIIESLQKLN
ncbi:MAG: NADH-quinone oxidoreductase subunit NuoE [Bdellovibrionota bacterium]|nr:NADH-quinone oxidoreductase subunit NuoE [Pseudobdellovibrionaceae bacterium]|tara:strand:+ start:21341 stop:21820 length:480 start_codon:yes stop_codon:yes gene_type:complete